MTTGFEIDPISSEIAQTRQLMWGLKYAENLANNNWPKLRQQKHDIEIGTIVKFFSPVLDEGPFLDWAQQRVLLAKQMLDSISQIVNVEMNEKILDMPDNLANPEYIEITVGHLFSATQAFLDWLWESKRTPVPDSCEKCREILISYVADTIIPNLLSFDSQFSDIVSQIEESRKETCKDARNEPKNTVTVFDFGDGPPKSVEKRFNRELRKIAKLLR